MPCARHDRPHTLSMRGARRRPQAYAEGAGPLLSRAPMCAPPAPMCAPPARAEGAGYEDSAERLRQGSARPRGGRGMMAR